MAESRLIAHHWRSIEENFKEEVKDICEILINRLSNSPYCPNKIFFSGITIIGDNDLSIGETGIISDSLKTFNLKLNIKFEKHYLKNDVFQKINQDIIQKEVEIDTEELCKEANLLYDCDFFELKYPTQNWLDSLRAHLFNSLEKVSAELQAYGSFKFISKLMNIDGRTVRDIGKFKIAAFSKDSSDIENSYKNIIFQKELNKYLKNKIANVNYQELDGGNVFFSSLQRFSVYRGKPRGYGVIETSDMKYTGEFKNGKFHGDGVMILRKESIKYEGIFANGYFINGRIYTIHEMFDEWCAKKDLYSPNLWIPCSKFHIGEFHVAPFEKAEKVYTKQFYEGVIKCEGNIINGKINGWGIEYYDERKYMEGEFVNSDLIKGKYYYYDLLNGVTQEWYYQKQIHSNI